MAVVLLVAVIVAVVLLVAVIVAVEVVVAVIVSVGVVVVAVLMWLHSLVDRSLSIRRKQCLSIHMDGTSFLNGAASHVGICIVGVE